MTDEERLTPEDYRRRYFALKENAQKNNAQRQPLEASANPKTIPPELVVACETIPSGWYWAARIARGQTLRIVNDEATAGVSAFFWNAHDTSERYNAGDTVKVQWTSHLTRGRVLLSDMGRVIAAITDDSCGAHDFILGGSTRASDARKYAGLEHDNPDRRNTHDNFVLAAGKHGMSVRDVGPCATFFAPVSTDGDGHFRWQAGLVRQGDYVDLRAELELIVALSNCPHPLSPATTWQARPVRAIVWRSPPAEADDVPRTASEEAARAFENTDALFSV